MQTTNLKNFVERQNNAQKLIELVQEYYKEKGELTKEDLEYISSVDCGLIDKLSDLLNHYEVQIMYGPDVNCDILECYTFFSYNEAYREYDFYAKAGECVQLLSVTSNSIPDGKVQLDNFKEMQEFWNKISIHDLRRLYKAIQSRYDDLDNLARRLQDDYNDEDKPFEQNEQGRLDLCAILDLFDEITNQ